MTPQAKLRFDVFREGQIAYGAQTPCPYAVKDWRSGTWQKGYDSAKAYYSAMPEAAHDLFTNSDSDIPTEICDRNGEVVLALCKRCGCAEIELSKGCKPPPTEFVTQSANPVAPEQTAPAIPKDIASFIRFMNYTFVPMSRQQEEIKKALELASTALLKAEYERGTRSKNCKPTES